LAAEPANTVTVDRTRIMRSTVIFFIVFSF